MMPYLRQYATASLFVTTPSCNALRMAIASLFIILSSPYLLLEKCIDIHWTANFSAADLPPWRGTSAKISRGPCLLGLVDIQHLNAL